MYISEITFLIEKAEIDFTKFWGHANALGKKVTVKGRRNDYNGYVWKNYFFYKENDRVKAISVKNIKSEIVK